MELQIRRLIRVLAGVLAVALAVLFVMLGIYLAGEDSYFGDGGSRWSHRIAEPDNRATLGSAVGLSLIALAALAAAVRSGRIRWAIAGTVVGTLAVVAATFTFIAFTAN